MAAKPHAPRLPSGDVLIGRGDRVVSVAFVKIHVYALGLYVESAGCRAALLPRFAGQSHDELLAVGPEFFAQFVGGSFKKTFRLVFCRALPKNKLVKGFEDAFKSRCDAEHKADADRVLDALVPDIGVAEDDVLTIQLEADTKTLSISFHSAATQAEDNRLTMESGGEGGCWTAFQRIFFDDDTPVPTIRHGAIADLPDVLAGEGNTAGESRGALTRQPTAMQIEAAVDRGLSHVQRKQMTWSEFAGRDDGGSGYRFGEHEMAFSLSCQGRVHDTSARMSRRRHHPRPASTAAKGQIARRQEVAPQVPQVGWRRWQRRCGRDQCGAAAKEPRAGSKHRSARG